MATTRKSTSRPRPVRAVGDSPAPVAINLDTLEREDGVEVPFAAVVGGKRLVFSDPQDADWQDLVDLDDPDTFAEICLQGEDRKHFLETRMPAWKMNELMKAFQQHYGLGNRGNASA
jgi:hypothetical protein